MKLKISVALLAFVTAVIPLSLSAEGGSGTSRCQSRCRADLRQSAVALRTGSRARTLLSSQWRHMRCWLGLASLAIAITDAKSGSTQTLRFSFDGSNAAARIEAIEPLPGITNYYIGQDQSNWRLGVRNFAKLRTKDVYPGVDVVYYGDNRRLEFDFVVAPMADPRAIALTLSGMDKLYINADGELVAEVNGQPVRFAKPYAYQKVAGSAKAVSVEYALAGPGKAQLQIGDYDKNLELVIDPTLSYSTYLGGSQGDTANGIAVDTAGNAYITGQTCSSDFPNPSGSLFSASCDAYVTKVNAAGTAILYTTLIGGTSSTGSGSAQGNAIALDSTRAAYIVGNTSFDSAMPGTVTGNHYFGADSDAFIAILNPDGTLLRSAYLGGSGIDIGLGVAVDSQKNVIAVGRTCSSDFPAYSGFQDKIEPCVGFITKLDNALDICTPGARYANSGTPPAGGTCYFSEYWGGQPPNVPGNSIGNPGYWIANHPYLYGDVISVFYYNPVSGITTPYAEKCISPGTSGGIGTQPTWAGGIGVSTGDGTVTWQNTGTPATLALASTTARAAAIDSNNDVFVAGGTTSLFIGCPLCGQWSWLLGTGPWVLKVSKTGAQVFSTVLESGATVTNDTANAVAVDPGNLAYVVGTSTGNLYTTANAYQGTNGGGEDAFIVKVNVDGTAFDYASYLGGSGNDEGWGVAVDVNGAAYITGLTKSQNFPMANPLTNLASVNGVQMSALSAEQNAFVTKFIPGGSALAFSTYLGGTISTDSDGGTAIAVHENATSDNDMYVAGVTNSADFPVYPVAAPAAAQTVYGNNGDAFAAVILGRTIPNVAVSPETLNFSPQTLNTVSAAQTVEMANSGTTALTINSIQITGDFQATYTCGSVLAANSSCTISVTFTPTVAAIRTGSLTITDNGTNSPQVVSLTGTGTALASTGGGGATSTTDFSLTPSTTILGGH